MTTIVDPWEVVEDLSQIASGDRISVTCHYPAKGACLTHTLAYEGTVESIDYRDGKPVFVDFVEGGSAYLSPGIGTLADRVKVFRVPTPHEKLMRVLGQANLDGLINGGFGSSVSALAVLRAVREYHREVNKEVSE